MSRDLTATGRFCCVVGLAVLLMGGNASALWTYHWVVGSGNWCNAGNWYDGTSPGIPDNSTEEAYLDYEGGQTVLTDSLEVGHILLGNLPYPSTPQGPGYLTVALEPGETLWVHGEDPEAGNIEMIRGGITQEGGTVQAYVVGVGLFVGEGYYHLHGGRLVTSNALVVGAGPYGTFSQTGGEVAAQTLEVGEFGESHGWGQPVAGTGAYTLEAGTITISDGINIGGAYSQGTLKQTGGYIHMGTIAAISVGVRNEGGYSLSGGTLVGGGCLVGEFPGSRGTVDVTAGFFNPAGVIVGHEGYGTFRQKGGRVQGMSCILANLQESTGKYSLSAGSLVTLNDTTVGQCGYGLFQQSGGYHEIGGTLLLGEYSGSVGIYAHSGGVLKFGALVVGEGQSGFNWTGGTAGGGYWGAGGKTVENCAGVLRPSSTPGGTMVIESGSYGYYQDEGGTVLFDLDIGSSGTAVSYLLVDTDITLDGGILQIMNHGKRPKEHDVFCLMETMTAVITDDIDGIESSIGEWGKNGSEAMWLSEGGMGTWYYVDFHGLTDGDANGDHCVDGGDLALMGPNWNQYDEDFTWADCDFNGDHWVDGGDSALLGSNWNWSLGGAPPAPIPEPSVLCLLGLGASALLRRYRR